VGVARLDRTDGRRFLPVSGRWLPSATARWLRLGARPGSPQGRRGCERLRLRLPSAYEFPDNVAGCSRDDDDATKRLLATTVRSGGCCWVASHRPPPTAHRTHTDPAAASTSSSSCSSSSVSRGPGPRREPSARRSRTPPHCVVPQRCHRPRVPAPEQVAECLQAQPTRLGSGQCCRSSHPSGTIQSTGSNRCQRSGSNEARSTSSTTPTSATE